MLAENYPVIAVPRNTPVLTPSEAAKGHDCVLMEFENNVLLTIDHNLKVKYPKGVHQVPREWMNHWYLKAHGVQQVTHTYAAVPAQ